MVLCVAAAEQNSKLVDKGYCQGVVRKKRLGLLTVTHVDTWS